MPSASKLWRHASALVTLLLALATQGIAAEPPSAALRVTGAVKAPLSLKVDDLKAFPPAQIDSATVVRGEAATASSVRGVRLTAVLERAALAGNDRNDWKHSIVLATATDGYQVAFSWPELFNTEVGPGVLVVFERDGQPLADSEGPIVLVSARDQRTGPRNVKWLTRLDVKVLKE